MYFVYVLRSEKDNILYIGQTNNLYNRLQRPRSGYVCSTRNRRPLKLIYFKEVAKRGEAMRREKYLKSGEGHIFLQDRLVDAARETGYR